MTQFRAHKKSPPQPVEQTPGLPSLLLAWVRRLLPVVFLLLIGWLAGRELADVNLIQLRASLKAVPLSSLIVVQIAALLGVLAMAPYDLLLSRWLHIKLPRAQLLRYGWVANTFNNFVGLFGLAGSGIRYLLLTRAGADSKSAAAMSASLMLSVPVGLGILTVPAWLLDKTFLPALPLPAWAVSSALLLFGLYVPAYLLLTGAGVLHKRYLDSVPTLHLGQRLGLLFVSLVDWLLAGLVAWLCLAAAGAELPPGAFLGAFVLAATLGIFSLMPGGLGVFDGVLLLSLRPLTASSDEVLAGIILFRVVYYLIPWLIGAYLGAGILFNTDNTRLRSLAKRWEGSTLLGLLRLPLGLLTSLGVRILAYLTFAAGVVLLLSAAFPAVTARAAILQTWVPLAAIESSHLLSVVAGVLLIGLARGIAAQVLSAYRLTQFLLLMGAGLSLLKGIDFEEALFMLGVATLLRLRARDFYRVTYSLFSARNIYWLFGLLAAVGGYALVGGIVYANTPYAHQLWLQFGIDLEAARYLRSLLIAVLVLLGLLGWILFRMPAPPPCLPDAQTRERVRVALQNGGGNTFAHLLYMGDKHVFTTRDERALIQYGRVRDRLVALGDPIASDADFETAITEFRIFADRYNQVPVFYQVAEEHLHHYHDNGFSLLKLGEQAYVDVQEFTLAGKRGEPLRNPVNRARREGVTVTVLAQPLEESLWEELASISRRWLDDKHSGEKGFSLGRFDRRYLSCAPLAVARVQGRCVAFASLLPAYTTPNVLSVDLMRQLPDAPVGVMDMLFVELIEYARAQGYAYFSLGMAPLRGVGETRYARTGERLLRLVYEHGNRFYNYKGLRSYKEKYQPEWRGSYLAFPYFTPVPGLLIDIAALIAGGYWQVLGKARDA